jgi:hypothetical protein
MTTTQTQATQTITTAQMKAGLMIVKAVADTIRELGEVPAGTLYAHMMDRMDLSAFEKMIDTLVHSGLVEKRNSHLLVWVG